MNNEPEHPQRDEPLTSRIASIVQQARIGECTAHEAAELIESNFLDGHWAPGRRIYYENVNLGGIAFQKAAAGKFTVTQGT